jgi:hypothetical protein
LLVASPNRTPEISNRAPLATDPNADFGGFLLAALSIPAGTIAGG